MRKTQGSYKGQSCIQVASGWHYNGTEKAQIKSWSHNITATLWQKL